MKYEKYYVVEHCSEDNWEQISQAIDSYENAIKFKDSDFVKNRFPKAFIVSTIPSQLLKQNNEMRELLLDVSILIPSEKGLLMDIKYKIKSYLKSTESTNP